MRIAVSGTHFMGKSTLIEDFLKKYPHYHHEIEPYYKLQDKKNMEISLEPSLETIIEQLDYSIEQLNENATESHVIFDRCPIDFIAYGMSVLEQDDIDIHESELFDRFMEVKEVLNHLDLIVFLPITKEDSIEYTEENPGYRQAVDKCFKKIYRDDRFDIFPRYGHPKIIEIWGDPLTRMKKLETYL